MSRPKLLSVQDIQEISDDIEWAEKGTKAFISSREARDLIYTIRKLRKINEIVFKTLSTPTCDKTS